MMRLMISIDHRDSSLVLLARNDMLGTVIPWSFRIICVDWLDERVGAQGLAPLPLCDATLN